MAEADLQRFLKKVKALNALVEHLESDPASRRQFAACSDHNAVVALASAWGFDIGRRWGETSFAPQAPSTATTNLLADACGLPGEEQENVLCSGTDWRLVRIQSNGSSTPAGSWYEQKEHEWLTLLKGSALLRLAEPDQLVDLSVGDQLLLTAGRRHRVERTDPYPGTTWLALYWADADAPGLIPTAASNV